MSDNDKELNEKAVFEQEVYNTLIEGEMKESDPGTAARDRLTPRYEIRVQAVNDPIVEETRLIRKVVKEIDDRYDKYISLIPGESAETDE